MVRSISRCRGKPGKKNKKKQRQYYSGKKKRHTHKTQLVVATDGTILCVHIDKGRKHDFRMFKESAVHVHGDVCMETDSAYQGIKKYHANSVLPYKHTKNKALIKEQQQHNHTLSSDRVPVEHTI